MKTIKNKDVAKAIRQYAKLSREFGMDNTPLLDLSSFSKNPHVKIFAKDESRNLTGSLKVRAALFNIAFVLTKKKGKRHFMDASSGNYAKALCYLAVKLGHDATLFIPQSAYQEINRYRRENR